MTRTGTRKLRDFTEGPILSRIILFSLPLIATTVLQHLFNTADTIVVGRWGGDTPEECSLALAAVGSCGSMISLVINLFMGLSTGAGVCTAHEIGARRYDGVERVVHTTVLMSVICGFAVGAFGFVAARPLLILMNTDPDVLTQAVPYMKAYFAGVPASLIYSYCAAMLRSSGDTARPLFFLSVAGVVNVLLNLVLVLVFHTGALGVGVSTAVSHWVSCVMILWYMMHDSGPCRLDLKKLRIDSQKLKKILMIGLPAGLQGSLFSISNVINQTAINGFGPVVVAGNTAANNISNYQYAIQNVIYQTAMTFVGQNAGAKRYDRVRRSVFCSICTVTVIGVALGVFLIAFANPLLRIFAPENEAVVEAGRMKMLVFCSTYFIAGIMEVGSGAMRGLGRSFEPMLVSFVGACLFRVAWVYTVFAVFPTLFVLYISYPLSWLLTGMVHYIMYGIQMRKVKMQKEIPT